MWDTSAGLAHDSPLLSFHADSYIAPLSVRRLPSIHARPFNCHVRPFTRPACESRARLLSRPLALTLSLTLSAKRRSSPCAVSSFTLSPFHLRSSPYVVQHSQHARQPLSPTDSRRSSARRRHSVSVTTSDSCSLSHLSSPQLCSSLVISAHRSSDSLARPSPLVLCRRRLSVTQCVARLEISVRATSRAGVAALHPSSLVRQIRVERGTTCCALRTLQPRHLPVHPMIRSVHHTPLRRSSSQLPPRLRLWQTSVSSLYDDRCSS